MISLEVVRNNSEQRQWQSIYYKASTRASVRGGGRRFTRHVHLQRVTCSSIIECLLDDVSRRGKAVQSNRDELGCVTKVKVCVV